MGASRNELNYFSQCSAVSKPGKGPQTTIRTVIFDLPRDAGDFATGAVFRAPGRP
jgi:hypothetical protein